MIITEDKINSKNYAKYYDRLEIKGTQFLAFRDLDKYIDKFKLYNKSFLDFGCGAGKSTRFLKQFSNNIKAVDINYEMIQIAKQKDYNTNYLHIDQNQLPFENNSFDFVFSSWVLMEFSTIISLQNSINEISRVLKPGGININVVCNKYTYSKDWLSIDTNFEENENLTSGVKVKIKLSDIDLTISDYYWNEEDYEQVFRYSKLDLLEKNYPKGRITEKLKWKDELYYSPYTIYVLRRQNNY